MKLLKSEEGNLVRLILQVNPKIEIGYSEVEVLGDASSDYARSSSPEK